ncbi:galanin receptor 2a [Aplochiton taeniatus]
MNLTTFYSLFGQLFSTNFSFWEPHHDDQLHQNWSLINTNPFAVDVLFSGHEPGTIVLVVMYTVSFITGLGGNIMALLVLTRKRNRLSGVSATRRLLVNLAICDMMVVCVCMPVNLGHQVYNAWVFGDFLCRAVPFVQAVSVSASVLSLAVISMNRYYSVHSPLHARSFFTGRRILCMISVVWAVSSGLCLPLLFMNATRTLSLLDGAHTVTVCVESWSKAKLRQGYNFLLFCSLYGFPVLFNLIICLLTGWKLWGMDDKLKESHRFGIAQTESRLRVRKRIAKMVLSLVMLFTLSWLPLYVVDIWIDFNMPDSLDRGEEEGVSHVQQEWILQSRPFAQWLGLTNSALNPLCYCFVGNLYRSAKRFRASYRQKLSSVLSMSLQQSSGNSAVPKIVSSYGHAQLEKGNAETHTSPVFVNLGDKLTKSKSTSSVTVCETVFD